MSLIVTQKQLNGHTTRLKKMVLKKYAERKETSSVFRTRSGVARGCPLFEISPSGTM
ncbi:hypothetical protein PUN28_001266 [Cardiocondyla obscurior]|uniref:Uncharacterized protein n=1 Tax=Cardiocondyla obscurior TaxID=286306 RepID=A0AAW2H469_9HYME